jgi:Carbamoylphosphate synthase large subunit (split gene in MJ)
VDYSTQQENIEDNSMTRPANILITSISKKTPLIKAVRRAMDSINAKKPNSLGKLIGADSDFHCIGRYFVDDFWHIPFQDILTLDEIVDFCKKHQINMIIPTRDGELPFFAKYQDTLAKHGIYCLVSSPLTIDRCRDKLLFCEFLHQHKIPVIPTHKTIEKIQCPTYVVKECFGAGAKSMGLDLPLPKAKQWAEKLRHPIFQPFIRGKEFSIDIYINRLGDPMGAIARTRELVKDGESQVTASVKMPALESMCLETAKILNIYGPAVFQVLEDESRHLHLIECNPRFGGASTLGLAMGLKTFEWFFQETLNLPLTPFNRSENELRQVRHPEDLLIPQ